MVLEYLNDEWVSVVLCEAAETGGSGPSVIYVRMSCIKNLLKGH